MIVISMAMLKEQRLHMKLFAFHLLRLVVSKAESEKIPEHLKSLRFNSRVKEVEENKKKSIREWRYLLIS